MTILFCLLVTSSLWYFTYETYKRMSFYDKMFMWKVFFNLIAITFFCTITIDIIQYLYK